MFEVHITDKKYTKKRSYRKVRPYPFAEKKDAQVLMTVSFASTTIPEGVTWNILRSRSKS